MGKTLTIRLPEPTPLQQRVLDSTAKRIVMSCGRRAGKTHLGALMAARALVNGKRVLIVSTSIAQSDVFWGYVKRWFAPLVRAGLASKNETRRTLEFGNGQIAVRTGSDADLLRGFDADLLILDECAYLDPLAWYEVGAPMLADRDGTCLFLSTPLRKNWFYRLFQRALGDTTGRWLALHATTFSNPHLSRVALDELVADMTEDGYKQEIMAEFLEGDGQVFRRIEEAASIKAWPAPYAGDFVAGVDTAQQQDYTVMIVLDRAARRMVAMDRFRRVSWESYRSRIKALAEKWDVSNIVFEINSVGSPNFEALANDGLPVTAFTTTAQSKGPLIESLVLAFERGELAIVDDPVLLGELGGYERTVSGGDGGAPQYGAPDGMHDDSVIALSLAWYAIAGVAPYLI